MYLELNLPVKAGEFESRVPVNTINYASRHEDVSEK
jgi:hypothetical protein